MDSIVIFSAKYLIFIVAILAFIYWMLLSKKLKLNMAVFGLITGIVAYGLATIGGLLFYNARPFVVDHVTPLISHLANNGFPSDHTLLAASIAVMIFTVSKQLSLGFMFLAIIIGTSRVLAHVHHPIDIIGSIVFAIIGGLVAYFLAPKILSLIRKNSKTES